MRAPRHDTTPDPTNRSVAARWIRATALGWAVGVPFSVLLVVVAEGLGASSLNSPIGAGMGLCVGLAQGRVLRGRIGNSAAWVVASLAGLSFPFLFSDVARAAGAPIQHSLYLSIVVGGVVAGLWQAMLLRPVSRLFGWWVAASSVGWVSAAGAVALADGLSRIALIRGVPGALLYLGLVGCGGLILGVVTGLALSRLLSHPSAA